MKVALDAQLAVGTPTGIGEYVRGLAGALRAAGVDVVELRAARMNPWRFDRRVLWDQIGLPLRARRSGAALLHCASGTVPLVPGLPVVVTVHDVAWLRVQRHARPYARFYFGRFALERYRRAAAIVVDSEFSRRELLEVMPNGALPPIGVVYPGVAAEFATLARQTPDGRTILAVGTVERRKNLERLIRALPALEDARLVSVGPPTPYLEECRALARSLGVEARVTFRGFVERSELLDLYARAAVVAMPSRYEGFGYPAAQALCAGVPVVVADCGPLPEVVAGDAPVVPPDDTAAWVRALSEALRGGGERRAAQARSRAIARFAWSTCAQQMGEIYASVDR